MIHKENVLVKQIILSQNIYISLNIIFKFHVARGPIFEWNLHVSGNTPEAGLVFFWCWLFLCIWVMKQPKDTRTTFLSGQRCRDGCVVDTDTIRSQITVITTHTVPLVQYLRMYNYVPRLSNRMFPQLQKSFYCDDGCYFIMTEFITDRLLLLLAVIWFGRVHFPLAPFDVV